MKTAGSILDHVICQEVIWLRSLSGLQKINKQIIEKEVEHEEETEFYPH